MRCQLHFTDRSGKPGWQERKILGTPSRAGLRGPPDHLNLLHLQKRSGHAWRAFSSAQQRDSLYTASNPTETRQRLFGDIAPVYDELNNRLSLGQHKVWKQMTVNWANVKRGNKCLDLCCGSGDLAFLLARGAGPSGQVVGLDFAAEMLDYARKREQSQSAGRSQSSIEWVEGDATNLPFEDRSFDAATMGYGLRNGLPQKETLLYAGKAAFQRVIASLKQEVADIPKALREVHRVLRPKSKAAILDFNNASKSNPVIDFIQGWALENVVVPSAREYGLEDEYRYLRPSIQSFPPGREQETLGRQAGFSKAVHYEIGFGLMGVLVLQK